MREEEDKAEAEKKTKSEDTKEEEKAYNSIKRDEEEEEEEEDGDGDDESTGLLSTSHRREEEDDDEEKKEDDHHNLRRDHHQNQTASSSISATRHIYPNVLEDGDGENENCAVGVPVLADGSIDFNAYERGGGGGGGGGHERTTRDYARALAESEGNQDVSVLLEDPSSSASPQSSSRNFVELQSYSTGLFDCALDPLNFLKNFLCVPWGVGEYARDTAQGECFPTALSITMGNLLLNNLCFPMGCFATGSCIHSSNAVAEHRLGIFDKTDLATALCCAPCVVSRMQREISARKALGVMPSREELILRFPNNEFDDWDGGGLSYHHGGSARGGNHHLNRSDFIPPRRVVRMVHRRGNMVGRM